MRGLALVLLLVACRGEKQDAPDRAGPGDAAPRPVVPDAITGKLALDGKPLAITACGPGRDGSIFVDLVTAAGTLRWVAYEDHRMFWNGAPLDCGQVGRSWGGGTRPDGTTYFRGRLIFSCKGAVGTLDGDVTLDCGNIDSFERKKLDENRQQSLDDQRRGSAPGQ
jgi:hypothetical protein